MIEIKYIPLREGAHIPQKAHEDDAGFDLYASADIACSQASRKIVLLQNQYVCDPFLLQLKGS